MSVRLSTRYSLFGALAGLFAPAGLFGYILVAGRVFDPLEMLLAMAIGGMVTLGAAGWMIGRRDDVLERRNRELRALSERLAALSATDALTGIPNRRTFDDRLAIELARTKRYGAPLSLVMVDLDHFKELNDRFGHLVGDEVLRHVAALLDREKRAGDVVARFGGEEFIAILPHTDARAAQVWAERARQLIAARHIESDAGTLRITASFGVTEAARWHDAPHFVEEADRALYDAKHAGRNRVVTAGFEFRSRKAV